MQIENTATKTKRMIDELKVICANYNLAGSPGEYKIITQVFLYKYLNDKFIYEVKKAEPSLQSAENIEEALSSVSEEQYEMMLMMLGGDTAKLKKEHYISYLFNHQNDTTMKKPNGSEYPFYELFDNTLVDIANYNLDVFSVQTGGEEKIKLFEPISQYIINVSKKTPFCKAIINKLVEFNFAEVFEQKYDFFAQIFEYLIKDYNKDFGKYAEYYTPHTVANIIARIMVHDPVQDVTVYDPAAGSGTLVLALAHHIGEKNCTIYAQDRSSKSNEFLRLNLVLNNLVHSLDNVILDDTLMHPGHLNAEKNDLEHFDYIVSNPPFNVDFSDTRDALADEKQHNRFFAGVPNIPKKDKKSMAIYLMFIQHILYCMSENAHAAIVVPSGFLTDTGAVQTLIREKIIGDRMLKAVIQMPTNIFANTNTSVSILFLDKSKQSHSVMFVDASKLGESVKIDDNTRTIFSIEDENKIVSAIENNINQAEFSVSVDINDIIENENLIKPGLYFEMQYPLLREHCVSINSELHKLKQKRAGLIRVMRSAYAQNLIIKWFVDFDLPINIDSWHETEYGKFPDCIELTSLQNLILNSIGGEWGKEEITGRYTYPIKCIRGTDIPNISKAYYDDIPLRYVQKKHIDEKQVEPGDIILEISGGSPVQSTGRICYISNGILEDLEIPVLCTNFCRILRTKKPIYSEYIYNYLLLLYNRGYFFNLENNTTGIKNLIFSSFVKNIKIPIPNTDSLIHEFYKTLDEYCDRL